jgi:hypothetical protein
MKKSTLITIADIVNNIDNSTRDLYEMLDLLNVTENEKERITDAIMITAEKIAQLRRAKISELDEFIDVNYIETHINRY